MDYDDLPRLPHLTELRLCTDLDITPVTLSEAVKLVLEKEEEHGNKICAVDLLIHPQQYRESQQAVQSQEVTVDGPLVIMHIGANMEYEEWMVLGKRFYFHSKGA